MSTTDTQLVARMAQADQAAAGEFFDLYSPRVFGLARAILRDNHEAEEVMQETLLQAWRHADDYRPDLGMVSVWVLRMARSRAIDRLRSRKRSQAREAAVASAAYPVSEPPAAPSGSEFQGPVAHALAELPSEQREAIVMAFCRGLTREEIATAQNVPVGTVKTRILLGIRKVRQHIDIIHVHRSSPVGNTNR